MSFTVSDRTDGVLVHPVLKVKFLGVRDDDTRRLNERGRDRDTLRFSVTTRTLCFPRRLPSTIIINRKKFLPVILLYEDGGDLVEEWCL